MDGTGRMHETAPPRVVDLEEWESSWCLDEDAYELVAGVPTVTPPEAGTNIYAAMVVHERLTAIRETHRSLPGYRVHFRSPDDRDTVRRPDLVVLQRDVDITRTYVPAADTCLVVEVVSPCSIERDWVTKRAEYAAAGLPAYLIIDVRGEVPRLWLFEAAATTSGAEAAAYGAASEPTTYGAASEPTTYPPYPDPSGDGTSVTIRVPGAEPITITSADLSR